MTKALVILMVAICVEVFATTVLPLTEGFRRPGWSAVVVGGYGFSMWLLAVVVQTLPLSTTYALWSGIGTAAIATIGIALLGEQWNWIAAMGLGLIMLGVVLVNLRPVG